MSELHTLQIQGLRRSRFEPRYCEVNFPGNAAAMDLFIAISQALADWFEKPAEQATIYRNQRMAMVMDIGMVMPVETARDFLLFGDAFSGKHPCTVCGVEDSLVEWVEVTWSDLPFFGRLCFGCAKGVGLHGDE